MDYFSKGRIKKVCIFCCCWLFFFCAVKSFQWAAHNQVISFLEDWKLEDFLDLERNFCHLLHESFSKRQPCTPSNKLLSQSITMSLKNLGEGVDFLFFGFFFFLSRIIKSTVLQAIWQKLMTNSINVEFWWFS